MIPSKKSMDKGYYWLLLTAAYGLENAHANWQSQSDQRFIKLGLTQCTAISQLFYLF